MPPDTPPPRSASPSWRERLDEARQLAVFSPTPSGAKPYNFPLEYLCNLLDQVEVTGSIGSPDSPTRTLCVAVAAVLRELINAREYERNMHARIECGPDRLDEMAQSIESIGAMVEGMAKVLVTIGRAAKPKADASAKE